MQYSYSELRQNLRHAIEATNDRHQAAIITSHKQPKAVLLSYEDYCSLEETDYLLKSPKNAARLLKAVTDLDAKKNLKEHNPNDET